MKVNLKGQEHFSLERDGTQIINLDENLVQYDDEIDIVPDFDIEGIVPKDLSMYDIHGTLQNTRETANSYVISKPGYYRFPLVYGNAISGGTTNSAAYTNGGGEYQADFVNYFGFAISSPFIEEDNQLLATSAGIEISDTDNIIDRIEIKSYPDEDCRFLQFRVTQIPSTGANAILSIRSSAVILWSWHIWLWKESLKPVTIENYSENSYQILPVNLASKYDSTGHLVNWFYQWGRKDPILCPEAYNNSNDHTSYGIQNYKVSSSPAVDVSDAIKNPCTFYAISDSNNNYNWVQLNYFYNFWDATCTSTGETEKTVVKTVYDPCPPGYSIPNARVFTGFTTTGQYSSTPSEFNVNGTWNYGWNFKTADANSVFFPATGSRNYELGNAGYIGEFGNYWTAGASYEYSATYLSICETDILNTNYSNRRSYGFSVRPCKLI